MRLLRLLNSCNKKYTKLLARSFNQLKRHGKYKRSPTRDESRQNMMYNFVRGRRSNESSRPSLLSE